jgi:hypothetical protein
MGSVAWDFLIPWFQLFRAPNEPTNVKNRSLHNPFNPGQLGLRQCSTGDLSLHSWVGRLGLAMQTGREGPKTSAVYPGQEKQSEMVMIIAFRQHQHPVRHSGEGTLGAQKYLIL